MKPPFRADHVGSFLRPPALKDARAKRENNEIAAAQLTAVEVLSALDALSTEHRLVLILAVVEGFTCKEIAGICSLPIGTVMSRLSRGRAELRKILVDSQYEEQSTASVS